MYFNFLITFNIPHTKTLPASATRDSVSAGDHIIQISSSVSYTHLDVYKRQVYEYI